MTEPVQRQQIGYDLAGNPMYAAPVQYGPATVAQQATAPLQPIKVHPWGAYLAGGCLGLLALTVVVVLVAFLVFGFAILAAVLAVVVVALVICLLILRDVWRSSRKS
ncbi:hypothetical protein PV735_31665 [Streptomyces turgidiscabies]|uniref:hypothetical protein n=1 Tax=Streptomyces TaxID=1883 RepID=UPI0006E1E196|nr:MULTISPECIES: hypothetical protein [Streptomyces]MDX3497210.1 hypothetical protein [Streptomyces turgidiscabies]